MKQKTRSLTKKGQKRAAGLAVKDRIKAQGGPDLSAEGQTLPGGGGGTPIAEAVAAHPSPPTPPATLPMPTAPDYRFEVALSFASDNKRDKVRAVAEILRDELGQGRVFFDEWFETELAGFDAQMVLQNIYRKATRLVVTCVCKRYGEKPWTQEEWRAIQVFERGLRDAGSENLRRMRLLPLRFGDGEVDGLFETAIVPDVRERSPRAIADLILQRLRQARGEREAIPPSPQESRAAPSDAPAARPGMPSPEVRERLARMKRDVATALASRPRLLAQLAARIGCDSDPEVLPDRLANLRGNIVAQHILAVYDAQPSPPESDADRDALQSVLFTVLPYVTDWRDEVAACCARGQDQADVVELRYRSDTIAEAVMAGWVGRRCFFEHRPGAEPYGVGAVQIPAASQTALFTSEQHLLEQVVEQLRRQLGTGGLDMDEQRLEVEAELRLQRERAGLQRMRYYFLFRDAASPGAPEALWRLARTTLHRDTGLPSLVLVRMQGRLDADQAALNRRIAAMLNPRTPPRS